MYACFGASLTCAEGTGWELTKPEGAIKQATVPMLLPFVRVHPSCFKRRGTKDQEVK